MTTYVYEYIKSIYSIRGLDSEPEIIKGEKGQYKFTLYSDDWKDADNEFEKFKRKMESTKSSGVYCHVDRVNKRKVKKEKKMKGKWIEM